MSVKFAAKRAEYPCRILPMLDQRIASNLRVLHVTCTTQGVPNFDEFPHLIELGLSGSRNGIWSHISSQKITFLVSKVSCLKLCNFRITVHDELNEVPSTVISDRRLSITDFRVWPSSALFYRYLFNLTPCLASLRLSNGTEVGVNYQSMKTLVFDAQSLKSFGMYLVEFIGGGSAAITFEWIAVLWALGSWHP